MKLGCMAIMHAGDRLAAFVHSFDRSIDHSILFEAWCTIVFGLHQLARSLARSRSIDSSMIRVRAAIQFVTVSRSVYLLWYITYVDVSCAYIDGQPHTVSSIMIIIIIIFRTIECICMHAFHNVHASCRSCSASTGIDLILSILFTNDILKTDSMRMQLRS